MSSKTNIRRSPSHLYPPRVMHCSFLHMTLSDINNNNNMIHVLCAISCVRRLVTGVSSFSRCPCPLPLYYFLICIPLLAGCGGAGREVAAPCPWLYPQLPHLHVDAPRIYAVFTPMHLAVLHTAKLLAPSMVGLLSLFLYTILFD